MQRLADLLDAPVDRPVIQETTALGAAYLAGLQAGVYPEPTKFADNWRLEHRFKPNMSQATRDRKLAGWARAVKGVLASDEGEGFDQGTTSSRAIVFRSDISIAARAQPEFPQHFPASGWVEHEPEDIWTSTIAVCRDAIAKAGIGAKDIAAIGITNQRETTVVWDRATGQAVHRAIVWQDRRTADDLRQTESRRPRAHHLAKDRPDHRSLFLRHQGRMDPRPGPRRAGPRRARRADVRHRRLLFAVAPHRRQGARHRRHQRLAHAAVQHPHRPVGRRAAGDLRRAALDAARGEGFLRAISARARRICSAARSRYQASPATSRPRPSAKPASARA